MTGLTAFRRQLQAVPSVLCLCLAMLIAACQPVPQAIDTHPQPKARPRPVVELRNLEKRVHELVNRERVKHGLGKLAWDDGLASVARSHSSDMAERSYFSHDSPEGNDFSFRYHQQGYVCQLRTGKTIHLGAENIALNHLYRSVTTINGKKFYDWNTSEEIASSTVQGWMDSPGHRKNILTPHWLHQGIGIHVSPDDKVLITQNFC